MRVYNALVKDHPDAYSVSELRTLIKQLELPTVIFVEGTPPSRPPKSFITLLILPGSNMGHWVACVQVSRGVYFYFDSYGVVPDESVVKLLRGNRIFNSNIQLQAFDTNFCGHHVLDFLYYFHHTPNFNIQKYIEGFRTGGGLKQKFYSPEGFRTTNVAPEVQQYARKQQITKLLRQPPKARDFLHYEAHFPNQVHQVDIMYLDEYKGKKYVLGVIDVYTRYAALYTLETRTANDAIRALRHIYENDKYLAYPDVLQGDEGGEFRNKALELFLAQHKTRLKILHSHAYLIERLFKTIATPIYAYRDTHYTLNWPPIIAKVIDGYNNSVHSTIKMTPTDAMELGLKGEIVPKFYRTPKDTKPKFKTGDRVLLRKDKYDKVTFRAVDFKYESEVYTVSEVRPTVPPTYRLTELEGVFYNHDLQNANDLQNPINDRKWSKTVGSTSQAQPSSKR